MPHPGHGAKRKVRNCYCAAYNLKRRVCDIDDWLECGTNARFTGSMLRKVPPLGATEAFLLAARAESFRVAADEMALSPSAFSRRIQQLEAFVGLALFDRSQPGMRLTEAGARYLAEVEPALETIRRVTADLREPKSPLQLRVGLSHSLAVIWLMRRLAGLYQESGIQVELVITRNLQALKSGAVDMAIWAGTEVGSDTPFDKVIDLEGVPVSAAVLADGRPAPRNLEELVQHKILSVRPPPDFWQGWFASAGYRGPPPHQPGTGFETSHMMYEAAASGLGVALAVPLLTERCLDDPRLQACADARHPLGLAYSLYYSSPEMAKRPHVRAFAEWLWREADEGRQVFDRWWDGVHARFSAPQPPARKVVG